jgi:hypothetical protein
MIHPMPLKHLTETVLVVILALIIVLTGAIIGVLPSLSQSILPWLVAFILSLAYPLALYPLLRSRRADYPFRVLQFAPAFLLLIWLVLDLLASVVPGMGLLLGMYVWGWTNLAVIAAFVAIAWFCMLVIRQRSSRLTFLALILVPFIAFGAVSERYQWRERLTASVWPRLGVGSGIIIAAVPDDGRNTEPSENPDEEKWRANLRLMDRRNARLKKRGGELASLLDSSIAPRSSSSTPLFVGLASSSSSVSSAASASAKSAEADGAGSSAPLIAAALPSSSSRVSSSVAPSAVSSVTVAWNTVTMVSSVSSVATSVRSSAVSLTSSSAASEDAPRDPWYWIFTRGPTSSSTSAKSAEADGAGSSVSSVLVASKPPPRLSSSGPGEIAGFGLLFAAAYCGVLHRRILKRRT